MLMVRQPCVAQIATLKGVTNKPIAVGFGVQRADQAAQLAEWGADGVIVGSALVRALGEASSPGKPLPAHPLAP